MVVVVPMLVDDVGLLHDVPLLALVHGSGHKQDAALKWALPQLALLFSAHAGVATGH